MTDNKFTKIDNLLLEKRRKYMRAYYLRTKAGKVIKKKPNNYGVKIKRGRFLVTFD